MSDAWHFNRTLKAVQGVPFLEQMSAESPVKEICSRSYLFSSGWERALRWQWVLSALRTAKTQLSSTGDGMVNLSPTPQLQSSKFFKG